MPECSLFSWKVGLSMASVWLTVALPNEVSIETTTNKGIKQMTIRPTPPFPVPPPTVGVTMLPILGAILVGCAAKAIWDKIFD